MYKPKVLVASTNVFKGLLRVKHICWLKQKVERYFEGPRRRISCSMGETIESQSPDNLGLSYFMLVGICGMGGWLVLFRVNPF